MSKLAPFNTKQIDYLHRYMHSWFNVLEGGKRGSKNVLQNVGFAVTLDNHPNRLHLVAGVSVATAKLNILDCDGVGLLYHFDGRCREGKFKDRDCLYINSRTGEKIVLVSGGGKNGDEKLIKGNTYGTAMVTEANECAQAFLQEVFDRTLSSQERKVSHDLNPKAEGHWYYTDILNFHEEQQAKNPRYGYNYGHTTIADNMSISDEQLRLAINSYDKKSVWYQRDILGKRKQAEGLIYPMFNRDFNVVPTVPRTYEYYCISNDYGVQHPCVFLLFGYANCQWYLVDELYHHGERQGQKTADEYYDDLIKFVNGRSIYKFYTDNAPVASSFNVYLRRKGAFTLRKADDEVLKGIEDTAMVFRTGKVLVNDCCKNLIRETGLYSWDDKKPDDEPIKLNDDALSAFRYFVRTVRLAVLPRR